MKKILGGMLRGYAVIAAFTLALVVVMAVLLYMSGTVTKPRVKEALHALRGTLSKPPAPVPPVLEEEWKELQATRSQADAALEKKRQELQKLDDITSARLRQIEAERANLEKERKRDEEEKARIDKERKDLAAARIDAEIETNKTIFSKLEGIAIVDLMRGYDNSRIVRYLRAFKPAKASEVLEAMRTDPQFEREFRTVPPDAPKGARTRLELIMEEFQRASQG